MLRRYIMKHLCPLPRPAHCRAAAWLAPVVLSGMLVAAPAFAALSDSLTAPAEVLALLNAQRAAGATCGDEKMPPAPPLQWHVAMEEAAADHVQDVARFAALSHIGSDGSSVGARVWRHGYVWGGVAENVAGGQRGAADALRIWLRSPSHCRTLMGPRYRHAAVVGRYVPGSRLGYYWVMVVARPMR